MLEVPAVPKVTSRGEWEVGNRNSITPPPPQKQKGSGGKQGPEEPVRVAKRCLLGRTLPSASLSH